ncbi:MAG: hypothetical protein ONB44_10240 [candidate division KSB1 bacterium]|nr:hypothetical protein [candidate division KSB1 bacterium]MDZ7302503.1 hypothetical protein [candidate division KSB1 bacterium]MDZ7311901.1 hypothetical protein [candidate division KSB1 bacterium]
MKWYQFSLVLALLFSAIAPAPAQEKGKGKLEEFVDDFAKDKKTKDKKEEKKDRDEKKRDDDEDDAGGSNLFNFLLDIIFSPGNNDGDEENTPETGEVSPSKPAPYPYLDDRGLPILSPGFRSYSVVADAGYLHLGNNLRGFQLAGDFRSRQFAARVDWHTLVENLGMRTQSLAFLGLNIGCEVIATPHLLARPYLGARNLTGLGVDLWGPEMGARLLMLPRKPFSIETNFSGAWINSKPLIITSATVGIMINCLELRFGGQMFRSEWTSLEGVRVGFRVWL